MGASMDDGEKPSLTDGEKVILLLAQRDVLHYHNLSMQWRLRWRAALGRCREIQDHLEKKYGGSIDEETLEVKE
ncbi:MAG: hypothetical protein HYS38_10190 [Acidobacteria bacterium]|nr:hypothetical protein [Acidobacteriota bacterium]